MRKTYVTKMPNHIGAFLKASKCFAELLAESKGDGFNPRVTVHNITENTKITLIQPNCGSNTAIIESDGERVFVDSG